MTKITLDQYHATLPIVFEVLDFCLNLFIYLFSNNMIIMKTELFQNFAKIFMYH